MKKLRENERKTENKSQSNVSARQRALLIFIQLIGWNTMQMLVKFPQIQTRTVNSRTCKDYFQTLLKQNSVYIGLYYTKANVQPEYWSVLDCESSAFTNTTTGWPFSNLGCILRAAKDKRNLTVIKCVHHGLLLRPHHGWIQWNTLRKTRKCWLELVFLRPCHRWPGWTGCCLWKWRIHRYRSKWSRGCGDVGNCKLLLLSTVRVCIISFWYCQRESSLVILVGFVIVVKGLYASVACDFNDIWAFNVCFLQLANRCFPCTMIYSSMLQIWAEVFMQMREL